MIPAFLGNQLSEICKVLRQIEYWWGDRFALYKDTVSRVSSKGQVSFTCSATLQHLKENLTRKTGYTLVEFCLKLFMLGTFMGSNQIDVQFWPQWWQNSEDEDGKCFSNQWMSNRECGFSLGNDSHSKIKQSLKYFRKTIIQPSKVQRNLIRMFIQTFIWKPTSI